MLQDMREGKLCPETRSLWSEYIMLQSLFLLLMHVLNISFNTSKTFQNTLLG